MRVAVDGHPVLLAVPGADRRLQVGDDVLHVDLVLDPVRHFGSQALAADVAFERRAHLDDVEIDGAGGDRLLQAGIVVRLRQVDPVDLGAGIGLPRLQEATKQHIVQVLVVEPHEGELDTGEFAFLDVGLGRLHAKLADLLEVGIGRLALADAGDLQDLRAQFACGGSRARQRAKPGAGCRSDGGHAGCALEDIAARGSRAHKLIVKADFHFVPPRILWCQNLVMIENLNGDSRR